MYEKLTSRKFWICTAAFLGSIASSVAALQTGNEVVAGIGMVCGIIAAAIYAATEAAVDVARLNQNQTSSNTITTIERNINVTANDKETAREIMVSETNTASPVMEDE